jgi:hypothetical protein
MVFSDGHEIEKQRRIKHLHPHFPPLVYQKSVLVSTASYSPAPSCLSPPLILSLTFLPSPSKKCPLLFNQATQSASIVCLPYTCPSFPFLTPPSQGPLTQNVKRSLSITNPNADPVSFKIKTTAPKVRPSRVQILPRLPVFQAVLCTAQLRKGRPRTDS